MRAGGGWGPARGSGGAQRGAVTGEGSGERSGRPGVAVATLYLTHGAVAQTRAQAFRRAQKMRYCDTTHPPPSAPERPAGRRPFSTPCPLPPLRGPTRPPPLSTPCLLPPLRGPRCPRLSPPFPFRPHTLHSSSSSPPSATTFSRRSAGRHCFPNGNNWTELKDRGSGGGADRQKKKGQSATGVGGRLQKPQRQKRVSVSPWREKNNFFLFLIGRGVFPKLRRTRDAPNKFVLRLSVSSRGGAFQDTTAREQGAASASATARTWQIFPRG